MVKSQNGDQKGEEHWPGKIWGKEIRQRRALAQAQESQGEVGQFERKPALSRAQGNP